VSYDLYLLRKEELGDDPSAAFERLQERAELDEQREPEEEERLRRLADLQAASPGLDLSEPQRGFLLRSATTPNARS